MLVTPDTAAAVVADSPSPLFEIRTETRVSRLHGFGGKFSGHSQPSERQHPANFCRYRHCRRRHSNPLFSLYGLSACSDGAVPFQIQKVLDSPRQQDQTLSAAKTAVFIVGLARETYPHVLETAMESCLKLQTEHGNENHDPDPEPQGRRDRHGSAVSQNTGCRRGLCQVLGCAADVSAGCRWKSSNRVCGRDHANAVYPSGGYDGRG